MAQEILKVTRKGAKLEGMRQNMALKLTFRNCSVQNRQIAFRVVRFALHLAGTQLNAVVMPQQGLASTCSASANRESRTQDYRRSLLIDPKPTNEEGPNGGQQPLTPNAEYGIRMQNHRFQSIIRR